MQSQPRLSRIRGPLVVALKVLGVFFLGVIALLLLLLWSCVPPSDPSLKSQFMHHQTDFATLAQMSQEDVNVIRVAGDFTRLKNDWSWPRPESQWGISRERWNEYRRLFRVVDANKGWEKDSIGNVYFIIHTHGLSIAGGSKGFVRCFSSGDASKAFLPCAEQKEQGRQEEDASSGSAYRRISSDWYIFEEWR